MVVAKEGSSYKEVESDDDFLMDDGDDDGGGGGGDSASLDSLSAPHTARSPASGDSLSASSSGHTFSGAGGRLPPPPGEMTQSGPRRLVPVVATLNGKVASEVSLFSSFLLFFFFFGCGGCRDVWMNVQADGWV